MTVGISFQGGERRRCHIVRPVPNWLGFGHIFGEFQLVWNFTVFSQHSRIYWIYLMGLSHPELGVGDTLNVLPVCPGIPLTVSVHPSLLSGFCVLGVYIPLPSPESDLTPHIFSHTNQGFNRNTTSIGKQTT